MHSRYHRPTLLCALLLAAACAALAGDGARSLELDDLPCVPPVDSAWITPPSPPPVITDSDPMIPVFTPTLTLMCVCPENDPLFPLLSVAIPDYSAEPWVVKTRVGWIPRLHPREAEPFSDSDTFWGRELKISALYIFAPNWRNEFIADCNDDFVVDNADLNYLIDHLYRDGPPPVKAESGIEYRTINRSDFNLDGVIDVQDLVMTAYFLHGFADPKLPTDPIYLRWALHIDSCGIF